MPVTKDKLFAVLVVVANGLLGATVGDYSDSLLREAAFAVLLSIPGLFVIWVREVLAETAPIRGLPRTVSPTFLAVIGWFLLLVIPALYVYELSKH